MNHYCTYFDRNYLAQGLALRASLRRHDPEAVLWVLALDEFTRDWLAEQGDPGLRVLALEELVEADPALAEAGNNRPRGEFIFTLSPCLPAHLLRTRAEVELVVYLDADLFFFGSPVAVREELGEGAVLITPHAYPRWHDDSALYGRFNVGVVAFRRDARAFACLAWWRERCLGSCSTRADGRVYGDQKYLDEWPARFPGLVECAHPGVNLAPWNWAGRRLEKAAGGWRVDGAPLVVFHFAQFRRVSERWFDSGQLEYGVMPRGLRSDLYEAYWAELQAAERRVRASRPDFALVERGWRASLGSWHLALLRLACGQFWYRSRRGGWVAGRFGLGRFSGRVMGAYRRWQRRRA
jgi:hypothetical protein